MRRALETAALIADATGGNVVVVEVGDTGGAIVVAHGGVTTDTLRTLIGDEALEALAPGHIESGVPGYAITTLDFDGQGWSVASIAATDYLSASR